MTTAPGRGKFTPEQRAAIAKDIADTAGTPEGSYRKIAARHGCALGTVQKIAQEHQLGDRWQEGQAQTAAATSVKQSNAAAKRAELENDLLDDAQWLRSKLRGNVVHLNVVKRDGPMAGEYVEETVLPAGPRDWRDTMGAIGVASSKSVELARLAAEQAGTGRASGLLEQFFESLEADRRERQEQAADEAT
jgi:transposase-like protein